MRRGLATVLLGCGILLLATAAGAQQPNIVLLQGDDWGWPYYGFMQRYLAAKIAAGELVADDPSQRGDEYSDEQLFLPDSGGAGRPVDGLITPALDWLAATGNFFPIGHNSATISQPAFAVIMTGLYPEDYVLTAQIPPKTTSPVIPEWLPATYLTLGAGKWQYAVSHVTASLQHKRPWDREVGQGGNAGEGGRIILKPYAAGVPEQQAVAGLALQRIKDFIACARCTDPAKCLQPPGNDSRPDNPRLAPRASACVPQPFFVLFSPFIPHLNYKFDDNCPFLPRNATQCATEPWKSRSLYCADASFDWSCASYSAALESALRPALRRRKVEYLKHINTFDRAVDELLVYLRCPGGGNPSCGEDLLANTVILHSGDHGWELRRSKGRFSEHAQRTPKILYDPRPGNRLPDSTEECGGQPGCRKDFAHAVDLLATIRDLSGSTFQCDATCGCSASCPNACPCPRPDGLSRYSEGRSLRAPTMRGCGSGSPGGAFTQCLFGREKGSQGVGNVKRGWDVLAEVIDPPNPTHLCKLYVSCGRRAGIFDLRSDPNERNNLNGRSATFCGSRGGQLASLLRVAIQEKGWYDLCFEQNLP